MKKTFKSLNHYRQYKLKLRINRRNRFLIRRARSRINRKINRHRQTKINIQNRKNERFINAVHNGNVALLDRLLSGGADPNFVDDLGDSPLLSAIIDFDFYTNESQEDVEYINNVDFNKFEGLKIIHHRFTKWMRIRLYIIILLINHGADINYRDRKGDTILSYMYENYMPLSTQTCYCTYFIIKLLNKLGVEQNDINKYGDSHMTIASYYSMNGCVLLALRRGGNINDIDRFGDNVLSRSAKFRHLREVRLALNTGGDRFHLHYKRENTKPEISNIIDKFPSVRCLVNLCLSVIFYRQVPIPEWVPDILLEFIDETSY